jgi:oligoribonuclease NrnB/cAMP/cGMP phosphodiesterase (DHH superfamily)
LEYDDVNVLRDTKHSAIVNMWRYLYDPLKTEKIPLLFQYLSGWDSFSWEQYFLEFNEVRYVNKAYTKESELSVDWYYDRMKWYITDTHGTVNLSEINSMYEIGKKICDEEDRQYEEMIKVVGDKEWVVDGNRKTVMVVLYGPSSSLMFQSLKDTEYKNGLIFKRFANGKWGISLYNINVEDTFDCGAYLKEHYNGGGHKGAAGAGITEETFIRLLKTKSL